MARPTRFLAALGIATALGACASVDASPPAAMAAMPQRAVAAPLPAVVANPVAMPACIDPQSVDSIPGKIWWAQQRWRYADDATAIAAYQKLETTTPPWPDWFTPVSTTLPAGTRFQMAMAPGQGDNQPGGFGTFDDIQNAADVREYLAVLYAWKPVVDRVITFELIKPLPAQVGPIGPQVDPTLCQLLPGRWSQFNMMVPPADRMSYLKVIAIRPIN